MNVTAPVVSIAADLAGASRTYMTLTVIYAVSTIGMIVTVLASFIALMIEGGGARLLDQRHALFSLVAGALAFVSLALIQFVQWSAILLRKLRRAK